MKKFSGIAVGALVCSLAASALAAVPGPGTEYLSNVAVDVELGQAVLWAKDGAWNGANCSNTAVGIIDISTENGRLMYQTALAAHLAGRPVKAYYGSSPAHCAGSYPSIVRIEFSMP
jgi:hypothetical protein